MTERGCDCITWAYDPTSHGPWPEPDHPDASVHHPLCDGAGGWKTAPGPLVPNPPTGNAPAVPDLALPTPLQAATLEELVEELAARFNRGLLVAGLRDATEESEDYFMDARNGLTGCLGLTLRAQRELLDLLADGGELREL
jgi:hypothetical protein